MGPGRGVHASDGADQVKHLMHRTVLTGELMGTTASQCTTGQRDDDQSDLAVSNAPLARYRIVVFPSYGLEHLRAVAVPHRQTSTGAPSRGFLLLGAARMRAAQFLRLTNTEQRYSGIDYVAPAQCLADEVRGILAGCHARNLIGRDQDPQVDRRIATVTLKAERDPVVNAALAKQKKRIT